MRLKTLFKDLPVIYPRKTPNVHISGLSQDSSRIEKGDLFIAKRGRIFDGNQFAGEAAAKGAAAILSDILNPHLDIPQLIAENLSEIELLLSQRFYHVPEGGLKKIGITGTSGKTTTAYMLYHLLNKNSRCGVIGTIETLIGEISRPALLTTPDCITLYRAMHEMYKANCESVVMEVTSHALDQNRIAGLQFDAAIFTNLSHEHLDYHKTYESYAEAKSKLFEALPRESLAIINEDDAYAPYFKKRCSGRICTFGIKNPADLRAEPIELLPDRTIFKVYYQSRQQRVQMPFLGIHNIYNALGAIAAGLHFNLSLSEIAESLEKAPGVKGRLQRIENDLGLHIFVDFAHKEESLKNVLQILNRFKKGRLITIFGCGGDRDREKRPRMAAIAEALSDYVIVTNDNPRSEDPLSIIEQIVKGFGNKSLFTVIPDRKKAIEAALSQASSGDIILIAGKGHESYQIFKTIKEPFDDAKIAQSVCSNLMLK